MDEQEMHQAFETLVGGPDRGFRLMRLYIVSVERKWPWPYPATKEEIFRASAEKDGYTAEEIEAFLELQ